MAIDLIAKPDERNDPPRPLLEHLLALRDMLVFAAVSWACGVVVAGVFAPQILELLKAPAAEFKDLLQVVGMTAPFDVWMSIAAWGGTVLSFPLVSFAVLRFVFPALTNREKLVILCGISFGTALFLAGAVLAYGKTLPLVVVAFRQIGRWMGIEQQIITIDTYIPIVLKLIVATGYKRLVVNDALLADDKRRWILVHTTLFQEAAQFVSIAKDQRAPRVVAQLIRK